MPQLLSIHLPERATAMQTINVVMADRDDTLVDSLILRSMSDDAP
jgi:hypothetical protein